MNKLLRKLFRIKRKYKRRINPDINPDMYYAPIGHKNIWMKIDGKWKFIEWISL